MPYAFEEVPGQELPIAHELPPGPIDQALAAIRALSQPPEQVLGTELAETPPQALVQPSTGLAPPPQPLGFQPPSIDRVFAERGDEVDLTGVEHPFQPPAPEPEPDPFQAPDAPTDLTSARQMHLDQVERAAAAQQKASLAKQEAERARLERTAAAEESAATAELHANTAHDRAIAMANARADAETAAHITRLTDLAKQEPNPGRWFENQSFLGQALWALSLVFGAAHATLTPGARNAALDMVRQNIAQDVRAQEARLKREMAVEELRGGEMRRKHQRNLSDLEGRHQREFSRIQALRRAWLARATVPGDLDAQAAKAESEAFFQEMLLPVVANLREEQFQANAQAIQREFSAAQQRRAQNFQAEQARLQREFAKQENELDRQLKRDLAPVSVSAGFQPGGAIPTDPKTGLPLLSELQSGAGAQRTTGLVLMGPDNQPVGTGAIRFKESKDMHRAGQIATGANAQYQALTEMHELLGEQSLAKQLVAGVVDPRLQALVTKMGTLGAKEDDPGGRYTNQDFSRGITGRIGFDPNGNFLERFKFTSTVDEIREGILKMRDELPKRVNQHIAPLNDAAINGQGTSLVWSPVDLRAPKVREPTERELRGETVFHAPPKDRKEYERRQQEMAADPNRETLSPHDEGAVKHVLDFSVGRGPDLIRKEAERVIKDLQPITNAFDGPVGKVKDPVTGQFRDPRPEDRTTTAYVKALADAEVKKATKAVQELEDRVEALQAARGTVSAQDVRDIAQKKLGLTRNEADIWRIYNAIKKVEAKDPRNLLRNKLNAR